MTFLLSLSAGIWFHRVFLHFPKRLIRQVYADFNALYPDRISYQAFQQHAQLPTQTFPPCCWGLFPLIGLLFPALDLTRFLILLILLYLSLLDIRYYLTDIHYIGAIFLLSVGDSLYFQPDFLSAKWHNFLFTTLFFLFFTRLVNHLFKQEGFGFGDTLLLIALSPLFLPEQMLSLILYACLSGLAFSLYCFCRKRRKSVRLPFIPFIGFSTLLHFIDKLPA